MNIDSGLIQPLRFYDTTDKQNFRKSWVKNGIDKYSCVNNPKNSLIPFQLGRKKSNRTITTFDLYTIDDVFYKNILTIISGTINDHLKYYQYTSIDKIIWNPINDFTSFLDSGYYYIYISDGFNDWYSEVMYVGCECSLSTTINLPYFPNTQEIQKEIIPISWNNGTDTILISKKPF